MDAVRIECLGCGEARAVDDGSAEARVADADGAEALLVDAGGAEAQAVDAHPHRRRLDPGECPRCGYLGWAPSTALTEPMRRRIRERPVDRRAAVYAV